MMLPETLEPYRNKKVWVNYVMIWNQKKHEGRGGYDKPPVNPHTLRDGSSTDSKRWGTFDEAAAQIGKTAVVYKNGELISCPVSGVGIVLEAAELVGVDMDAVIYKEAGKTKVSKEAARIWQFLNSYTELSPSGTGIHVLMHGRKPPGSVCKIKRPIKTKEGIVIQTEYEMYDRGRYFTFTGRVLNGCTMGAEKRQSQINEVYQWFETVRAERCSQVSAYPVQTGGGGNLVESNKNDQELWEMMFSSKKGDEIRRLFNGDLSLKGGDHSSCDLALCNHLAYWTNLDGSRIDRMFRQSGLMRPKWNRKDYRAMTIKAALSGKSAFRNYTAEEKREYARRKQDEELAATWIRNHGRYNSGPEGQKSTSDAAS